MLFGLILVIVILVFFTFRWFMKTEVDFLKNYHIEDEPFELTELSKVTPTPTPVYTEKKKRGRKPKKS
jgi:hypothetical protein